MARYFDLLAEQFEYDLVQMSNPWMYYLLLIPILFYLAFFFIKWMVLTAPIWLPGSFILGAINLTIRKSRSD